MIDTAKLDSIDTAIRRAALADSFIQARGLFEQYCAEVERSLGAGALSPLDVSELARRTYALFEWITLVAHSSRARLNANLVTARGVSRYRAERPVTRLHLVHG